MKGEFQKSGLKYGICLFFMLPGCFIAVRFAIWGMDEWQAGRISSFIFCMAFLVGGLLSVALSILLFNFNRNAFLIIENGEIHARFGWGSKLHTKLSHITNAEIRETNLILLVDGKTVLIGSLLNAKEICEYIRSQ